MKIVFAGPMGAGKTTAIRAISDMPPVSTEARNLDQSSCAKETTTVAMDFGQVALEDGTIVRLYGTPGQTRFSFMWEILSKGSLGVILLIDGSRPTAMADLTKYANLFRRMNPRQVLVIGVGRLPVDAESVIEHYARALGTQEVVAPIFAIDARNREDVLMLVETLLSLLEAAHGGSSDKAA